MQLSETVKLYPTKEQYLLISSMMDRYIATVNGLVSAAVTGTSISRYTSKDVRAELPSALRNQCIRDARSIVKKHYKACHTSVLKYRKRVKLDPKTRVMAPKLPVLKRPCAYINNQNYRIQDDVIEFPVMLNGRSHRISVRTKMTGRQAELLSDAKLGTLRIVRKNHQIVAQIVYEVAEPAVPEDGAVMGVDLGIKCPAVSHCSDGTVRFYGNGRHNKYMRRHFAYLRKRLQKGKHLQAVVRINNKEQRIMKDLDHKISHDIVAEAVKHHVNVIKLEQLSNIRRTTRTSRKNNHSLHTWSFYRMAQFIAYKARLAGITVEWVNPAYTSQTCPICGSVHHAEDRNYTCRCGFHIHRDVLGARNIYHSTEYVGNRHTA